LAEVAALKEIAEQKRIKKELERKIKHLKEKAEADEAERAEEEAR
jgi:hypothetical protein